MREQGFWLWARVMRLCSPAGPNVEYVKNERGLITRTERDSYRNDPNLICRGAFLWQDIIY